MELRFLIGHTARTNPSPVTTRVLIVDDHPVVRTGVSSLLVRESDIDVVAEASSAREAVAKVRTCHPDVVVMDLVLPGGGLGATEAIMQTLPGARVLVLTVLDDPHYAKAAFDAGARGYLLKSSRGADLVAAVRALAAGADYLDPAVGARLAAATTEPVPLSPREREILRLITLGYTYREIGDLLNVTVGTVATHRARIAAKLGVSTRAELIRYARLHGLAGVITR